MRPRSELKGFRVIQTAHTATAMGSYAMQSLGYAPAGHNGHPTPWAQQMHTAYFAPSDVQASPAPYNPAVPATQAMMPRGFVAAPAAKPASSAWDDFNQRRNAAIRKQGFTTQESAKAPHGAALGGGLSAMGGFSQDATNAYLQSIGVAPPSMPAAPQYAFAQQHAGAPQYAAFPEFAAGPQAFAPQHGYPPRYPPQTQMQEAQAAGGVSYLPGTATAVDRHSLAATPTQPTQPYPAAGAWHHEQTGYHEQPPQTAQLYHQDHTGYPGNQQQMEHHVQPQAPDSNDVPLLYAPTTEEEFVAADGKYRAMEM